MEQMRSAILALSLTILAGSIQAQSAGTSSEGATAEATSPSGANQLAWLQYISAELRRLHLEILEDRRELQKGKVQDLQNELEAIQSQQHQLQEEQRSETQQATETEGELGQSSLSKAEREELEARRAELQALSPTRFAGAQNALTQREARVRERLALQEQRVRAIEQQLHELSPDKQ
jgi:hypothetical protein